MTWQLGAALNGVIGVSYLTITWLILRGLWRTHQAATNTLALATAAIFFTCGVHHGGHAVHVLLPSFGLDQVQGNAMRRAFSWQMDAWDVVGAGVAVFYLTLRRNYGRLLDRPEMFENTVRQRYEEQLERERAALAEAQRLANLGSWELDLTQNRVACSEELCRLFGMPAGWSPTREELAGMVHPADRQEVDRQVKQTEQTGRASEGEFRILRHDGEQRVLRARRGTRRDPATGQLQLVGTVQDITETQAMLDELEVVNEQLRVTVEYAPIGVALTDLHQAGVARMLSVNDVLCELVGYDSLALREMTVLSLVHPDDTARLERDLTRLGEGDTGRTQTEVRFLHRDGHIVWALLSAAVVTEGAGHGRRAVLHALDIGERKRFEGQLQYLADHDALTGLYNRRRFEEELDRALAHAERYQDHGAVLMIDLDGFKYVNDTVGHSHGDQLITHVGSLLQGSLRSTDVLARLGGDEFAVILPRATCEEALVVCDKIMEAMQDRAIALSENRHARVTASIGVTAYDGRAGLTAEELLMEADIAMYEAKEMGKNQAATYVRESDHRAGLIARQSWLERLKEAIIEERFALMAQPIRGICANGVERYELLLRLRGEDDDLIPPGTFLYIAERFDLIQQIDRWVFAEAAAMLGRFAQEGHDISLSVNMSGKTLCDPAVVEDLTAILARHPVQPDRLVVEVTETAAIVNIDKARHVARSLRELGCQFALDDFGAGFASFYYLKHLDFDYLKIDGEFIKSLNHNFTDQLVVQSVVHIAQGLGAQTIAEFVGDDEVLNRLRELGVDYGQGYHLGYPEPATEILPALA